METRGAFGFRIDGQDKLMYNHYDSYPNGLGEAMLCFLRKNAKTPVALAKMAKAARAMLSIDTSKKPTPEQVERCKPYTNLELPADHDACSPCACTGVSNQSTDDWYCLLREAQGDLTACLKVGLYVPGNDFILDSLYCEYAYIVNLDDGVLEFYVGFQNKPHENSRYAKMTTPEMEEANKRRTSGFRNAYYPCALVKTFKLARLPKNAVKQMEKAAKADYEANYPEEAEASA